MEWKNFYKNRRLDFSENWLITYSDMITIILCFFIVFFTLSAEEASMLEGIKDSLSTEVKDLSEENKKLKEEQKSLKSLLFGDGDIKNDDFIEYLKENGYMDSVEIEEVDKGLLIRFKEGILFSSGSAKVSDTGFEVLNEISKKIQEVNNSVIIEGYTDNKPIVTSKYPTNWELSVDRAIGVAKYLIDDIGIDEERITVSGRGEQNPIDTNSTEEGRANNRRIEITILN